VKCTNVRRDPMDWAAPLSLAVPLGGIALIAASLVLVMLGNRWRFMSKNLT
jgi:hypothetical protein